MESGFQARHTLVRSILAGIAEIIRVRYSTIGKNQNIGLHEQLGPALIFFFSYSPKR
jgi:hypothetical protein